MSTESPASHQTGGASSCRGADVGPAALEDCLGPLLSRCRWDCDAVPEAAARAARCVLPALTTLAALRPLLGPWDGVVHRRCRLVPLDVTAGGAQAGGGAGFLTADDAGAAVPSGGGTRGAPAWVQAPGGWRTLTVSLVAGPIRVTHWLARREGTGAGLRPGTGARGVLPPPAAACPATARDPGEDRAGRCLRLTAADVAAWARATGDRNTLHLLPGAAARAGLSAGGADVVAHGTLLAALSLAVAPAQRADLRLLAPAVVPPDGLPLHLAPGGDVVSGGRLLLRRR
ncbi:hypothetical protein [Actinomyces sp. W5033]|uniref:hypothetical protein n=1 Tax=Actinomyces sp. W5033 TaxID=3446479 RepID=UPI003EDF9923